MLIKKVLATILGLAISTSSFSFGLLASLGIDTSQLTKFTVAKVSVPEIKTTNFSGDWISYCGNHHEAIHMKVSNNDSFFSADNERIEIGGLNKQSKITSGNRAEGNISMAHWTKDGHLIISAIAYEGELPGAMYYSSSMEQIVTRAEISMDSGKLIFDTKISLFIDGESIPVTKPTDRCVYSRIS